MKLKYVSITGADDAVDIDDLSALGTEFPFAEFAILLMPEAMGQKRFPTLGWIEDFAANYKGAHKAMHLCGSAFLGFVKGDADVKRMMRGFDRIQLNLKFGDVAGKYDPEALLAQVKAHSERQFIIQYAPSEEGGEEGLLPLLRDIPNHAILFDESAGRGIVPDRWSAPLEGHFCGYAGGLKPGNLAENLPLIAAAAGDAVTWIDMETGVRTEDCFDLVKVREVLKIAVPFCQSSSE